MQALSPAKDGGKRLYRHADDIILRLLRGERDSRRLGVETLDVAADELSISVINRYLALKARTMI